jgi:hypothetical protein
MPVINQVVNNPFLFILQNIPIFLKGSDANGNMGSFDPFSILRKLISHGIFSTEL